MTMTGNNKPEWSLNSRIVTHSTYSRHTEHRDTFGLFIAMGPSGSHIDVTVRQARTDANNNNDNDSPPSDNVPDTNATNSSPPSSNSDAIRATLANFHTQEIAHLTREGIEKRFFWSTKATEHTRGYEVYRQHVIAQLNEQQALLIGQLTHMHQQHLTQIRFHADEARTTATAAHAALRAELQRVRASTDVSGASPLADTGGTAPSLDELRADTMSWEVVGLC